MKHETNDRNNGEIPAGGEFFFKFFLKKPGNQCLWISDEKKQSCKLKLKVIFDEGGR